MGGVEVIKRTALAAVYAGVALPLTIFQTTTTAFDSDFTRCRVRVCFPFCGGGGGVSRFMLLGPGS